MDDFNESLPLGLLSFLQTYLLLHSILIKLEAMLPIMQIIREDRAFSLVQRAIPTAKLDCHQSMEEDRKMRTPQR